MFSFVPSLGLVHRISLQPSPSCRSRLLQTPLAAGATTVSPCPAAFLKGHLLRWLGAPLLECQSPRSVPFPQLALGTLRPVSCSGLAPSARGASGTLPTLIGTARGKKGWEAPSLSTVFTEVETEARRSEATCPAVAVTAGVSATERGQGHTAVTTQHERGVQPLRALSCKVLSLPPPSSHGAVTESAHQIGPLASKRLGGQDNGPSSARS